MRKVLPFLGPFFFILALTRAGSANAQNPFEDVKPDHDIAYIINDLQAKGYLTGYPDHYFHGQRRLTRYEFAIALKRALDGKMSGNRQAPKGDPGRPGRPGLKGDKGDSGPPGMPPAEVDELRRLTTAFKNDLGQLRANMRDVQNKLDNLTKAVADINRRLDR